MGKPSAATPVWMAVSLAASVGRACSRHQVTVRDGRRAPPSRESNSSAQNPPVKRTAVYGVGQHGRRGRGASTTSRSAAKMVSRFIAMFTVFTVTVYTDTV